MNEQQPTVHTFQSPAVLAEHLAGVIIGRLREGISSGTHASLVVSGGSTPKPLFTALSKHTFDWPKVIITLADERWVDTTDPASNERLVRNILLQEKAQAAHFLGLKNSSPTAREGEEECHRSLLSLPRPFDVVLLGMGNDGHTASLFPGARQLDKAMDMDSQKNCIAVSPEDAAHERMTLTLPTMLDAKLIILHITGPEKKKVLDRAMNDGPKKEMPVRAILKQHRTPVHICWSP